MLICLTRLPGQLALILAWPFSVKKYQYVDTLDYPAKNIIPFHSASKLQSDIGVFLPF